MSILPSPSQIKTLLIEDNPGDARLIAELLSEVDGHPFALEWTNRLGRGLECLARGDVEVVLLDLTLPECQGLTTVRRVHERAPGVPVVVLTGLADAKLAVTALQEGAEDYLVKGEVDANTLVRSLRYAIERTRRRKAEQSLRANEEEFRVARRIQQKLFPEAAPSCPGFDIHGASYPAVATGGDYFDYFPLRDGRLAVVIGDVSGHGFGPALLMAETRAYLRAFALTHSDVGDIVALANRALAADTAGDPYVTLLLARLDPRTGSFVYASAGHTTCYVLNRSGAVKTLLQSTCLPLGIEPDGTFAAAPALRLEQGDIVLLLTDGVLEAGETSAALFGVERALGVVRVNRGRSARAIVEALYAAVRDFCPGADQYDDITALVIKVETRSA
jgi:serine phosphatase RsbU (regulator of sigma subunit)